MLHLHLALAFIVLLQKMLQFKELPELLLFLRVQNQVGSLCKQRINTNLRAKINQVCYAGVSVFTNISGNIQAIRGHSVGVHLYDRVHVALVIVLGALLGSDIYTHTDDLHPLTVCIQQRSQIKTVPLKAVAAVTVIEPGLCGDIILSFFATHKKLPHGVFIICIHAF